MLFLIQKTKSRFKCFLDFVKDLRKNVKSCTRLLINGSFVRNVVNPYDIDFIMVIDSNKLTIEEHIYLTNIRLVKNRYREEYDTYKELYENQMIDKKELYDLDFFKFGCDFFRLDKLYDSHPSYDNYLENKKYWIEWWSHDRYNNPKGFLDLKMSDEVI